jgi:hypothetical protein
MEVLLQQQVQWDITVGIVARDGELLVTPYLGDPEPAFEPLDGAVQLVWRTPLVVAGVLPPGVVSVEARAAEAWERIEARAGVWIARAGEQGAVSELVFVRDDGTREPVPALPAEPEPTAPELNDEGRAFASTLADAIARDVAEHGPEGPLRRVVVRWFWSGDPAYLTIHVLGDHDAQPSPEDAWYPLEWANEERELERTDRVLAAPAVQRAAETLTASFPHEAENSISHLPAVVETVTLLPAALRAAGIDLADRFATSAAHFEGWGALDVLEGVASGELLAALEAHGELPAE